MKVFKELIPSITRSVDLRSKNLNQLTKNKVKDIPVVVSLTSFGERINKVDIAIRSILSQSYLSEKIVLNLNEKYALKIPKKLKALESETFEINFVDEDCPHIKLVPTLKKYSDQPIITVDDDVIYSCDLIENLYAEHLKEPRNVIANHVRVINYNDEKTVSPYKNWKFDGRTNHTKLYLALGFGGVLYPPNIFDDEVFDKEKYMKLAPKADDLWFKAMELRNGIKVKPLCQKPKYIYPILGTQGVSLKSENVSQDRNKTQWEALVEYYQLNVLD